jgi:multidrug efflux system membrane fusion protein
LAVAVIGLVVWRRLAGGGAESKHKAARALPVLAAKAKRGEMQIFVSAIGSVTPVNIAEVRSRADGELIKIHFLEGEDVKAGDLLAEIDPRAYRVALEQADGALARDQAFYQNAKLDLERYMKAGEAVTQQQASTAKAVVDQYAGAIRSDQGVVDAQKLLLSYCQILAPISGRVGLKQVNEGNLIRASDANGLVLITQEKPIATLFSVPEDNLPGLKKQMAGGRKLTVQAYDRIGKTLLATGEVLAIDNQIDPSTGTVRLKAVFANEDQTLFPNQFVNIKLRVEDHADAVLIPTSAVQTGPQEQFVYIVDEKTETVDRRSIVVAASQGETTSIAEGLKEGDAVVTDGLDKLVSGMKVSLQLGESGAQINDKPRSKRRKHGAASTGGS